MSTPLDPDESGPVMYFSSGQKTYGREALTISWPAEDAEALSATGGGGGGSFAGLAVWTPKSWKSTTDREWTGANCKSFWVNGARLGCSMYQTSTLTDGAVTGYCDDGSIGVIVQYISSCESDPVNTATGAYEHHRTDLAAAGAGEVPFAFRRSYNSNDPSTGLFGKGWSSVLDQRLVGTTQLTKALVSTKKLSSSGLFHGNDYPPYPDVVVPGGDPVPAGGSGSAVSAGTVDVPFGPPRAGKHVMLRASSGAQLTFAAVEGGWEPQPGVSASLTLTQAGTFRLCGTDLICRVFDASGRLARIEDRNGLGFSVTYQGSNPTLLSDDSGRTITLAYTGSKLTGAELSDGRSASYGYTGDELTSVTDPDGDLTTYAYTGGRMSQIANGEGEAVVTNTYDPQGRVATQANGENEAGSFTYPEGQTVYTDARGNQTTYAHSGNQLLSITDGEGGVTSFSRNESLDLASVSDPRGKTWQMGYADHDLVSVTGPAGTGISTSADYGSDHLIDSFTDARGNATAFAYDPKGTSPTCWPLKGSRPTSSAPPKAGWDRSPATAVR